MRRIALMLLAMLLTLGAIGASGSVAAQTDQDRVIVAFASKDGSPFRVVLDQPEDIARVEAALAGDGDAGIPNGELARGDGGVNAPHAWHMVNTEMVDITIELCDGTATMVDEDVTYWVDTVGRFCPWSATVIDIEPVAGDTDPGDGGEFPAPPGPGGDWNEWREQVRQWITVLVATLLAIIGDL